MEFDELRDVPISRRDILVGSAGLVGGILLDRFFNRDNPSSEDKSLKSESREGPRGAIEWLPQTVKRWTPEIKKYCARYDVDPNLAAIIMTVESGGDPKADSGQAKGLMQISDARAEDISSKFLHKSRAHYDLFDPETSIEFGVANIAQLMKEFDENQHRPPHIKTIGLVAAGYNGGEGAARKYRDHGLAGVKVQQTHSYIRFVVNMWRERHHDKSPAYRRWYDQANGQSLVRSAENFKK